MQHLRFTDHLLYLYDTVHKLFEDHIYFKTLVSKLSREKSSREILIFADGVFCAATSNPLLKKLPIRNI